MTSRKLLREIDRERRPFHFWGFLIALTSSFYGHFILTNTGYLITHVEPQFKGVNERVIGILLILAGIIKVIGVITRHRLVRKIGIVSLSAIWSALFVLAVSYSFGTGYPNPSWIPALAALLTCWRISLKGEFNGL